MMPDDQALVNDRHADDYLNRHLRETVQAMRTALDRAKAEQAFAIQEALSESRDTIGQLQNTIRGLRDSLELQRKHAAKYVRRCADHRCRRGHRHRQCIRLSNPPTCIAEALKANTNDKPSQIYIDRCDHYLEAPPPEGWSGEWVMTSK